MDGRLTGGVLSAACRQYLPEDDLVDTGWVHAGLVEQSADDSGAKLMGRHLGELAPETADGSSGGGNNHDLLHAYFLSFYPEQRQE